MIREYNDNDYEFLQIALVKLQEYLREIDPTKRIYVGDDYPKEYTNSTLKETAENDGKIFIAEINGKQVGMISCIIEEPKGLDLIELHPFKDGRVTELFLDNNYRGKNIAQELLKACEEYFISKDCEISRIDVFGYNNIAKRFYEKCEYDEIRNIEMCKYLKDIKK